MAGISISMKGDFKALDTLEKKSKDVAAKIKQAFNSDLGKKAFAGLAIAATASSAAIVASMKSAVDAGGALADMMARTGASGENLAILGQAFKNAGMAAEQVPQSINKMQKALAGVNEDGEPTADVIAEIGLSVRDLLAMDPAEALMKVGASISAIEDPAKRAELAMRLFGKSGGEMLVLMTDPTAFSAAKEQLGGLAKSLAENAAAFDVVSDALGLTEVKAQQMGTAIAIELLPQLLALAQWINETDLSEIGTGIGEAITQTLAWSEAMGSVIADLIEIIGLRGMIDGAINTPITQEEIALNRQNAQAEADLLLESQRGKTAPLTPEEKAADDVFAETDPFAEPGMDKEGRAAADKEWADLVREQKREFEKISALQIEEIEAQKQAAAEKAAAEKAGRDRVSEILNQNVEDLQNQQNNLQFQSTIGAVSSMQRLGGGGGAASSGMDYARQSADLQREMLVQLRAIAATSAGGLDN